MNEGAFDERSPIMNGVKKEEEKKQHTHSPSNVSAGAKARRFTINKFLIHKSLSLFALLLVRRGFKLDRCACTAGENARFGHRDEWVGAIKKKRSKNIGKKKKKQRKIKKNAWHNQCERGEGEGGKFLTRVEKSNSWSCISFRVRERGFLKLLYILS